MGLHTFIRNIKYLYKIDLKKDRISFLNENQSRINIMLDNIKYEIFDEFRQDLVRVPIIEDRFKTLDILATSSKSICRYGDGEFDLMCMRSIPFQVASIEMATRLKEVLTSQNSDILIGIPAFLGSVMEYIEATKNFTRMYFQDTRDQIYPFLDFKKTYYDSCVSRPYINYTKRLDVGQYYKKFKSIWTDKDVIIIEGSETRMGVGNDLLDNAKSIKRILCPALNAYDKYQEILNSATSFSKNVIFLVSLGPTATILSYDLSNLGFRALDTGHLDIEYEWFLSGTSERIKIDGKYVNEALGGNKVSNIQDEKYNSQIAMQIL